MLCLWAGLLTIDFIQPCKKSVFFTLRPGLPDCGRRRAGLFLADRARLVCQSGHAWQPTIRASGSLTVPSEEVLLSADGILHALHGVGHAFVVDTAKGRL